MTFVCLSSPTWPTGAGWSTELAAQTLAIVPRIRLETARQVLWADARGLDGPRLARELVDRFASLGGGEAHAGVAATPIAADVAARFGSPVPRPPSLVPCPITVVPPGTDREFLAPHDLGVLHPPPPPNLFPLLAGIGIECCADLARLDQESVEIRLGAEGVRLWRLARADDSRLIFDPRARELPSAELEWVDYELETQEQVVFIVNSLLGSVTDLLASRREGAHEMSLEFSLANRTRVTHPIHCSNPTADRKTWLRVMRAVLETVTFDAPVMKIALAVEAATPLVDRQGSLFDQGFATASATEAALAHLLDKQSDAIVTPVPTRHPLPEARIDWTPDPSGQVSDAVAAPLEPASMAPCLTIQLVAPPRSVEVRTAPRRGETVPLRYFDGARGYSLLSSLGPDRQSGGFGEQRFARDYFQGVRDDGMLVLLYRDLTDDRWFLAGWWD
jgi:hypothetical protein